METVSPKVAKELVEQAVRTMEEQAVKALVG